MQVDAGTKTLRKETDFFISSYHLLHFTAVRTVLTSAVLYRSDQIVDKMVSSTLLSMKWCFDPYQNEVVICV